MHMHPKTQVWWSEDILQKLALSFRCVGPRDRTQVRRHFLPAAPLSKPRKPYLQLVYVLTQRSSSHETVHPERVRPIPFIWPLTSQGSRGGEM